MWLSNVRHSISYAKKVVVLCTVKSEKYGLVCIYIVFIFLNATANELDIPAARFYEAQLQLRAIQFCIFVLVWTDDTTINNIFCINLQFWCRIKYANTFYMYNMKLPHKKWLKLEGKLSKFEDESMKIFLKTWTFNSKWSVFLSCPLF